jgi:hypothetical protein
VVEARKAAATQETRRVFLMASCFGFMRQTCAPPDGKSSGNPRAFLVFFPGPLRSLSSRDAPSPGLYWHFVDLVWIFLYGTRGWLGVPWR